MNAVDLKFGKVFLLILSLGVASAGAGETAVRRDIPYYADEVRTAASDDQKARCRLDVRVPVGVTGFPTVVWFHGGGLTGGGKHFIRIDAGIAQVAANYRLLQKDGRVTGDDCIDDAAAAVVWTLKNIAAFGGDPKKVYVSGMSAGGYLTMMVGMDPSRLGKYGFRPTWRALRPCRDRRRSTSTSAPLRATPTRSTCRRSTASRR